MFPIFFADLKVSKSVLLEDGELFKYKSCMENRLKRRKTVYIIKMAGATVTGGRVWCLIALP